MSETVLPNHNLTESQKTLLEKMYVLGEEFITVVKNDLPQSREQSLAITNIEQAVMWANKGIARNS